MQKWEKPASKQALNKAIKALKENGFEVFVAENSTEAKAKALELIPVQSEVMTMTSATMDAISVSKEINETNNYNSVRKKFAALDRQKDSKLMKQLGSVPQWATGSVHAVTEDGKILIASASGSQLPAYAYGASNVLLVVGTQKIVKNLDKAFERLEKHTFPLENARAKKAYGSGSSINKILILNKEPVAKRTKIILIKKAVGF